MKKKFENPQITIALFKIENIVTQSGLSERMVVEYGSDNGLTKGLTVDIIKKFEW